MKIKLEIEVELRHVQGKFASKEDMGEQLRDMLENENPGSMTGSEEGEYEVEDWTVTVVGGK